GTAKVEAISLNTSEMRVDHINLKPTVFNKMYNLRLLQIFECIEKCKLHLPQGLDTLPDTLRYLNWPTYPLKSLPSSFMPQNLDLGGCSTIDKFPELPKNLRMLHLSGTAIEQVPSSSFECLPNLEVLYLENCTRLKSLPTSIYKLESLVTLNLSDCTNFKSFPEILEPMEYTENLELVPNNIYNIRCLEYLDLSKCPKLESLPALSVGFHCKIEVDLSYNSILKVPHWNFGLSSLTLLDLTDITTGRRHVSMERLFNMILFSRGNNETGDFQMDSLLAKPQACRCSPLDNSNFSNFLFCGCPRFDEAECTNMAAKFLLIVLWEAIWFKMKEIEREKIIFPRINLCCPGNEIPWWFSDQSKGSSKHIKLSPNWHNPDFLGFAFCFVVEFEHYCFDVKHLNCCCEYHLKTNHGESYRSVWRSQRPEKAEWMKEIKFLNSDHLLP
ncbi:disease resistance-like protein DSC1, partial [Morus notabilis]|uniref:disease resistance-like protein DSC1 n=1 Tax=Morus notabilis TaxID=981085 RepID=UPI000CED587E